MLVDLVGILAGVFVILAFYARAARPLRTHAILPNVLFMIHAVLEALIPVLLLRAIHPPLNLARLRQIEQLRRRAGIAPSAGG